MKIIECSQGTKEWLEARAGVITASRFIDARDRLKRASKDGEAGDFSEVSRTYAWTIVLERIAQQPLDQTFKSWHMRRGQELEDQARLSYEVKTKLLVDQAGLILTDDECFGYSADGLVGDDGIIEIKTPSNPLKIGTSHTEIEQVIHEYIDQIQGGLWITGRKWCDLVIYCDWLKPIGKDTLIHRILRDEDYIEKLEIDLVGFKRMVDSNLELITQGTEYGATNWSGEDWA